MSQQFGFWRSHATEEVGGLPWPSDDGPWDGQAAFIDALRSVEADAGYVTYRGWSTCRLCGQPNGSRTFVLGGWRWPEGYAHYAREHNVQPTPAFRAFVEEEES